MYQCPRGCDAFLEYVGVDDGFGMHGNLCCDIWQCPACLETVAQDCENCEDDEEFGDHEHQLEEKARRNDEVQNG